MAPGTDSAVLASCVERIHKTLAFLQGALEGIDGLGDMPHLGARLDEVIAALSERSDRVELENAEP